jgi:hypothetical protein
MTTVELNAKLAMGKRDIRRLTTHLRTIRERLQTKADNKQLAEKETRVISPKKKKAMALEAENRKWEWRGGPRLHQCRRIIPQSPSKRTERVQARDLLKRRDIRDMLPSLRVPGNTTSYDDEPRSEEY